MELTIRDYYKAAKRTMNPKLTWDETRAHAILGMVSEIGEVCGIFQKKYQGHDVNRERVMDEMGDAAWFWMELCFAMQLDPQEVLEYNIHKLESRYPDGFSPERSVHRHEYEK